MPSVLERRGDTRAPFIRANLNTAATPSQGSSVGRTEFRHVVREFFVCPGKQKAHLRQRAIRILQRARDPQEYVDELLRLCTTQGVPDGLDVGIDVLSETGPLALSYSQWFFLEDMARWSPTSEVSYQVHDDVWYILLRASARASRNDPGTFRLIKYCAEAGNRGLRDAVALALFDLGTEEAREFLAGMARDDPDSLIRQTAIELLEDSES